MSTWKKTTCTFCALHCGLEMEIEDNHIINVRPDPDNPRSKGYCCRKGRTSKYYQENADRLNYPLKRVGDGFERITWEQAIDEIALKLKGIVEKNGPRSVGFVGGAGANTHSSGPFSAALMGAIGSQYMFNPVGCEFMCLFWNMGKSLGRQFQFTEPDEERLEVLVMWGCNAYVSHQMINARAGIRELSEDPDKMFIVVDPRLSETARISDIHVALRPGTDSLLLRTMIALILKEGWQDQAYLDEHVSDFDKVKPWFENFDIEEGCRVCQVPYEEVHKLCKIFTTRKWGMHVDLGVFMGRHNTMTVSLQTILMCVCGQFLMPGGTVAMGALAPLGPETDDHDPAIWKLHATGYSPVVGVFPEGGLAPEILNDDPEHIRALLVGMSNPARSYPDTAKIIEALKSLELSVVCDVVMTETAQYADYVLPTATPYESYDFGIFQLDFPAFHFMLKTPVVQPEGERLETGEVWLRLADAMGYIPELPKALYDAAANKSRMEYFAELMGYLTANPQYMPISIFIIGKTLGKAMGSVQKAILWAVMMMTPPDFQEDVVSAGFTPGSAMMDDAFQAVCDNPQGIRLTCGKPENNFKYVKYEDKKIRLFVDVLDDYIKNITPEKEEQALCPSEEFPYILSAGSHMDAAHNGWMRNPDTYQYRKPCMLSVNPEDCKKLGVENGQKVRVTTKAGSAEIEVDATYKVRPGYVIMPHQFGFDFNGKRHGVGANLLTSTDDCDKLTGDPLWRYTLCRVEAV